MDSQCLGEPPSWLRCPQTFQCQYTSYKTDRPISLRKNSYVSNDSSGSANAEHDEFNNELYRAINYAIFDPIRPPKHTKEYCHTLGSSIRYIERHLTTKEGREQDATLPSNTGKFVYKTETRLVAVYRFFKIFGPCRVTFITNERQNGLGIGYVEYSDCLMLENARTNVNKNFNGQWRTGILILSRRDK